MSTPDPVLPAAPAIPWYESRVQLAQVVALASAGIAIFPKVGTLLGLTSLASVQSAVELLFGAIAFIAPIVGSIWRAHSALQPLTLTKAAAAIHPATIAVAAAQVSSTGANNAPFAAKTMSPPASGPNDKPAA